MKIVEAAVLGLVQGLTEFLPISSTAHLRLVPAFLGWPDAGAAFTAVLQLGTLVAVIGFFLRELLIMLGAALSSTRRQSPPAKRLYGLIVGTIPIGVAGVLLRHHVEGALRSLWVIAFALVVVGILLAFAERAGRKERSLDDVTIRDAFLIGLAQTLALVPGTSRSGITLIAALLLGMQRDAAARFSFLLSVPAVAAAGIFELPKVIRAHDVGAPALAVGLIVATVTGYASIAWLLRYLRTKTTTPFVIYRVALGVLLLALLVTGHLTP